MHAKYSVPSICCVFVLLIAGAAPAFAQISASATMTATPNGANWDYDITLHNTGSVNIETFWFAWIPGYDYLPSSPTVTGTPTSWTTFIENLPNTNRYSIEFYDTGTSNPLTSGNSSSAFQFTSPDSPTTLQGSGTFGLPDTYSYIYSGPGESGSLNTIFQIPITTVPEPASFVLAGLGGLAGLMAWRRRLAGA
jgi:hypothetical protein